MTHDRPSSPHGHWLPRVSADRCQFLAWPKDDNCPSLSGFVIRRDSFVRTQTTVRMYCRVRTFESPETGTWAYLQYRGSKLARAPMKLTLIPSDRTGLRPAELRRVANAFRSMRVSSLELAVDFAMSSGVDRTFVLKHGVFGRSELRGGRLFSSLRYGSRKSSKLVRAYEKEQTHSYRLELELRSGWLRRYEIAQVRDLQKLPALLVPTHMCFVRMDWEQLEDYLKLRFSHAAKIIAKCCREPSFPSLASYLRDELGVVNLHRFWRPLPINRSIKEALVDWGRQWAGRTERSAGE
jgi:hypothetical protein